MSLFKTIHCQPLENENIETNSDKILDSNANNNENKTENNK